MSGGDTIWLPSRGRLHGSARAPVAKQEKIATASKAKVAQIRLQLLAIARTPRILFPRARDTSPGAVRSEEMLCSRKMKLRADARVVPRRVLMIRMRIR